MSQVSLDGFDLCDNVANSEALTAQTQNLNQTQSLPLSQNDEEETLGLSHKASLNDNVKDEQEEVKRKEEYTGRRRDEDEEEDMDEVMKEEEEESEASSSLVCCQSPDIPMTDSSYSETGRRPKMFINSHYFQVYSFFIHLFILVILSLTRWRQQNILNNSSLIKLDFVEFFFFGRQLFVYPEETKTLLFFIWKHIPPSSCQSNILIFQQLVVTHFVLILFVPVNLAVGSSAIKK